MKLQLRRFHPGGAASIAGLPCFLVLPSVLLGSLASVVAQLPAIKLNQIQVISTHNSYHAGIAPNEAKVWQAKYTKAFADLDYSHPALATQLDGGVRQIELDIFADTKGGSFSHPSGPSMAAAAGLPADPDFDPDHLMDKPGFKVMHVQDIDYRSNCQPFIGCLQQVREWSRAHPDHIPIFIIVGTKQDSPEKIKTTKLRSSRRQLSMRSMRNFDP